MKTSFLYTLVLAATSLLSAAEAQSTWETVDDLAPAAGRDIVADGAGNFISLALDYSTANAITAVSRSADGGATWQTVGSIAGYALDLTVAPDGALFAAGNRSATVSGRAFVWQSLDQGATWTISDPWAGQSTPLICSDVAAGNSGAVYLSGCVSGGNRWVVRKGQRISESITWSTVDNFTATGLSQPNSVFVHPAGAGQPDDVFVCGKANNLWTVRRSANGGLAWTTLDSYNFAVKSGYENSAFAATTAPDGSIYVVGRVSKPVGKTTEYGWLVRKSANGGVSWLNVDYVANGWPQYSVTVDAFNRVFAVGFKSTTPYTWLVRGSEDNGATWITTDLFLPAGVTQSQAFGVASDALGNVCVVGATGNSPGSFVAPIRRLAAP
jgi:hypothetical protein